MASGFGALDWLVLGTYFAVLAGGAALARRRVTDARDYFVGHGQMPSWAVALSVLASAMSVATYLGAPEYAFSGNLTYLISNLGTVLAVVIVAYLFVPVFYRQRVVTVYEVVGNAFGPRAKMAASWTFLLGRTLASGARLFMAAIPAGLILLGDAGQGIGPLIAGIALLAAIATVYTLAGGIASIIWTDVAQFAVTMLAVIAALIVLWMRIPAGAGDIVAALAHADAGGGSKFRLVDWSGDPTTVNTVWTALTGYLLLNLAVYGTDQDLAQRMLTCRNAIAGGRSALMAIAINIPVTLLFMTIGLLLFVFYRMPSLMGASAPTYDTGGQKAFVAFILHEMPKGLAGLMMAGLFAIAFTSLLSAINAMAAAVINDGYRHLRPRRDEEHYLLASRWAVIGCGILLAVVAVGCAFWQKSSGKGLIEFALGIMTIPYAGLLGVFISALFTGRGNGVSACAALIASIVLMVLLQGTVWPLWAPAEWPPMAWPWQMTIGTVFAVIVCCIGPRRAPAPAGAAA